MNIIIGQLAAVLTAACWAQNSIIYAHVGRKIGSTAVTHMRLWLALPMVIALNLIFTGELFPLGLPAEVYINFGISGLIGFFIADLLIFKAFVDLGPRETLVIMTLSPIFSSLISWMLYSETLGGFQILGILVTIAGVIWVIWADSSRGGNTQRDTQKIRGVLFALGGMLTQSIGMVLAKGGMDSGIHAVSGNLLRTVAGLAGLAVFAALRKEFFRDFGKMKHRRSLILLLFAATAGPVLGVIMALFAMSRAPVGIVTAIMQISPIMLLPVEVFWQKKKLSFGAVAGTFLAIGGTVLLFVI